MGASTLLDKASAANGGIGSVGALSMTRRTLSETALAVDPLQMDPSRTTPTTTQLVNLAGSTVCSPDRRAGPPGARSWLRWAIQPIDLHQQERDRGLRNAWIAVASAVGVGVLNGGQVWYFYPNDPKLGSHVAVVALVAFVLAPLIVGVYLALPDLARRLLWRLREDRVIQVRSDEDLDAAAPELGWFNHKRLLVPAAGLAGVYFVWALANEKKDLYVPIGAVVVISLVVQAVLVYLAVVATCRLFILSRAVGKLLRGLPLHIQPLHPDNCGGLWIVGRTFSLTLNVAAVFGGVTLCLGIALGALDQATLTPYRRPELYLMALFYLCLLPSAFLNLLWLPHKLMEHRRSELLKSVAGAFDATIDITGRSSPDDADGLRAKADSLSAIVRHVRLLDEISPKWPLRMKRLGPVVVTAVLPVAVPLVTTVLSKLVSG
jgi:hypothetical protein